MELEIDETGYDLGEWTRDSELKALALHAEAASRGAIVEIGSWKGKATVYLASGAKRGGKGLKVYAIDPHIHGTERVFRENIKKLRLDDTVVPLVIKSEEAVKQWHQPISLLFIDGDHRYESVRKDFVLWEPYVVTGGVIAFHDRSLAGSAWHGGPAKVIRDYILKSNLFGRVRVVEETLFATKGVQSTFSDKLLKFKCLLLSYVAILVNNLTEPRRLRWLRRILGKVGRWIR